VLAERALSRGATVEQRVEGCALASRAALALGQHQAAEAHADQAVRLADILGTARARGVAALARGRVDAALGRDGASGALARAVEHFQAARCPWEQAEALQEAAALAERLHVGGGRANVLRLDAERLLAACR
jgi:hypothetical protein